MQNRSACPSELAFADVGFEDVDVYGQLLPESQMRLVQTGPRQLNGRATVLRGEHYAMVRLQLEAKAILTTELREDRLFLAMNMQAGSDLMIEGKPLSQTNVAVVNGANGFTTYGERRDAVVMAFEPGAFRADLAALAGSDPQELKSGVNLLSLPAAQIDAMRQAVARCLGASSFGIDETQRTNNLCRVLRDAFLDAALQIVPVADGDGRRARDVAARFLEAVAATAAANLSVASLCSSIGVSRPTLYRAVRDICGVSPASYIKARRFTEARRLLRRGTPGRGAVKRAALDSGHFDLGRFSVEYRRFFGESPTETLHR